MGGDHPAGTPPVASSLGSPPHGRGPLHPGAGHRHHVGLTPAWAGTTSTAAASRPAARAHPRMGGDHLGRELGLAFAEGSPPHGRGPPLEHAEHRGRAGLTPAWAGTTNNEVNREGMVRAHPRMGGDHSMAFHHGKGTAGSPPHGRGPPRRCRRRPDRQRLTPAWAGTTSQTARPR